MSEQVKFLPVKFDASRAMIVTPTHDGSVCSGYARGLAVSGGMYSGISFLCGMSHITLVRALQVSMVLKRPEVEWLISIDADIDFNRRDLEILCEGPELVVSAEYSKKNFTDEKPNQFGLGFTRIHRSVFDILRDLKDESSGAPMVGQFFWQGDIVDDFFPSGPDFGGHWCGEDHGFFRLCHLANIPTRRETRTRLIHWGRHGYHYKPMEESNALPDAQ